MRERDRPAMDVKAAKRRLRRELKERIAALDPAQRAREEDAVRAIVPMLPGFASADVVLLYASVFAEEIATRPLLEQAQRAGKRVLCPRVDAAERRLRIFEVRDLDADLEPGALGIPEPRAGLSEVGADVAEWILVPGLGFDRFGFRLGRGAGYYDRLLAGLRAGVPRWSIALGPQFVERLPREPHDQPVHGVVFADGQMLTNST